MSFKLELNAFVFEPKHYASNVSRINEIIQPTRSTMLGEPIAYNKRRIETSLAYTFDLLSDSEIETITQIFEEASGIVQELQLIDSNEGLNVSVKFYDQFIEFEAYDFDANRLELRFRT